VQRENDMTTPLSIERRQELSHKDFIREYVETNRPVIITDALTNWKALGRWNLEFFKSKFHERSVVVDSKTYTMSQLIELIEHSSCDRIAPYLRNQPLKKVFPELMSDVSPLPAYFSPNWLKGPFFPSQGSDLEIYIGGAGGSFPYLHYDGNYYYAFLCQLCGRKEFVAYGPDQTPFLYAKGSHHRNHSEINSVDHPDLKRFPLFAQARGMRFELGPGEILYIPGGWWHTAKMITSSITVSMNSACRANWKHVTEDICYKARLKSPLLAVALRTYLFAVGLFKSVRDGMSS
jgi:histone arginine demethylase JMJD6